MIRGRHVRKDWQTFVDWPRDTVRTMCNKKSTPRLSGIPGITIQDVEVDGEPGWCLPCIVKTMKVALATHTVPMETRVRDLYAIVLDECYRQITSSRGS